MSPPRPLFLICYCSTACLNIWIKGLIQQVRYVAFCLLDMHLQALLFNVQRQWPSINYKTQGPFRWTNLIIVMKREKKTRKTTSALILSGKWASSSLRKVGTANSISLPNKRTKKMHSRWAIMTKVKMTMRKVRTFTWPIVVMRTTMEMLAGGQTRSTWSSWKHLSSMERIGTKFIASLAQGPVPRPGLMLRNISTNWARKTQRNLMTNWRN